MSDSVLPPRGGVCRFENRLAGRATELRHLRERIAVDTPDQLAPALARIEALQREGCWVALMLDYELGEWLVPHATQAPADLSADDTPPPAAGTGPRLVALCYEEAHATEPWPAAAHGAARVTQVTPRMPRDTYLARIAHIRERIAQGATYQINFSLPLDVATEGDPRALYQNLAYRHPSAHGAYIEDEDRIVLSFSPELFVQRRGDLLSCRPMKGTAPRQTDPKADLREGRELQACSKNRAENLMIVDLLRNDLGRLADPGTVQVDRLFDLERYASVWTMTSTITARVPDRSLLTLLQALFPCGSITGAPKLAAMQHIRRLEIAPRGLYCGSIGLLEPNGDFSLNVAIRTLVLARGEHQDRHEGVYGVGGGIVYDSDPALEWEECLWKARIIREAP